MNRLLATLVLFPLLLRADQSVTLAWDPNPEPDVSSYVVYYGTNSRAYPNSTNVGNVTTATVYGLKEGRTHYFAITARNTSGLESDFSNEVTNAIPDWVTNNVPTISGIADCVIAENQTTNLTFTIWDIETNPSNLIVTATSTNTALLPNNAILLSGTNHSRTITLSPTHSQSGQTLVTIVVSDGTKASSTSVVLTVVDVPQEPLHMRIISFVQVATNALGPWRNVETTIWPINYSTNLWYRTWTN